MSRIVIDLVEHVNTVAAGATTTVAIRPGDAGIVAAWCARTGNELVSTTTDHAVIRRGPRPASDVPTTGRTTQPVPRLWLYTNFDCNLACDYCCVSSSPRTPRRALGPDRVRRLAAEAAQAGITEIFLTGGEPFLLPDLYQVVTACTDHLPTTLLTNAMLFRGRRLSILQQMPRDRLTLQISLDSASPTLHDQHRGAGTWQKARDGISIALTEGFRVRVAATVAAGNIANEQAAFHDMLDQLGIPRHDQLIRPIALRGAADDGLTLTTETLIPEITVTADGVFWHPVAADHPDQLVTTDLFPLQHAIDEIHRRFTTYRTNLAATAQRFPCA